MKLSVLLKRKEAKQQTPHAVQGAYPEMEAEEAEEASRRERSLQCPYLHVRAVLFLWREEAPPFPSLPCHGVPMPRLMEVFLEKRNKIPHC